ncbi:MAG: leucine--tRNA ligase [Mycoplasmataceae bacterium]|nr:leucine--tRNA ligase [Mycoplasmataceae bacterium]
MYNHNLLEKKWQKYWQTNQTNKFVDSTLPKYYVLDMFPYPSGAGLHVGHLKGYTATDIVARYKKLCGFDVLHPIGWDAFGLPAEQYAIDTGNAPEAFTQKNIETFREQLKMMGFNYDYTKEVNTTDPQYYKWTQWIFSKLFENGLAEIRDIEVNWSEKLGTVLANEEVLVINGKMVSERGHHPVVKKPMRQWVLKITKYANKLLEGLDTVDWPESLKLMQRNWIGRSEGALITFETTVKTNIEIFTTRPDTIYGVTFICVAPENALVEKLTTNENKKSITKYVADAKTKTDLQRKELQKNKTGIFTGSFAINPFNNKKIPIYVADYVLNSYATGVVMGVPGHDQRDYDFALQYKLPIEFVIKTSNTNKAYEDDGVHINSPLIDGLHINAANEKIIEYLHKHKIGKKVITFKMKDWIFSRQRYWGEPFPIAFDDKQKPHLIKELPVLLPKTKNITPSKTGASPLANLTNWVNIEIDGKHYQRETNTMPQWAGSCWYYLGYLMKQTNGNYLSLDDKKTKVIFDKWLPIDLYVGGQEHAVLHLLYARFWYRFLYDIGIVSTKEPFQLIVNQGMILGSDGSKMSKSKGNVINPNDIVKTHGADTLRLYEMFMGPLTASLPWTDNGVDGIKKWLERVHRLYKKSDIKFIDNIDAIPKSLDIAYHKFIKQITNDLEILNFNVAISQMMIYINRCYNHQVLNKTHAQNFLIVLSCFAPHLAEELWHDVFNHKDSVTLQTWPTYEKSKTIDDVVVLPIQENGKLRATIQINLDDSQELVIQKAYSEPKVIKFINDRSPKKIIYIKNKILNFIFK